MPVAGGIGTGVLVLRKFHPGHGRLERGYVKIVREIVEKFAIRSLGTMPSQPEPTHRPIEIMTKPTIRSPTLSGKEISTHLSPIRSPWRSCPSHRTYIAP